MMPDFEWDEAKNRSNIRKHGVDFAIAKRIFLGALVTEIDGRGEYGEIRYRSIGSVQGGVMVVAGGVIPKRDHEYLENAGVSLIFGPGTVLSEAARDILLALMENPG